jgi:hypothetical protein
MRRTLLLLSFLGLIGCPPLRQAPSPSPTVPPDSDLCGAMCKHIGPRAQGGLGCEEGESVYDSDRPGKRGVPNKSCEDFCREQQAHGVFVNPRCIMKVETCSEIEAARQRICQ